MHTDAVFITLRASHPHEARLIEDLTGRPTGRRAQRVRELLGAGLERQPPAVPWADRAARRGREQEPLRIGVYVDDTDPQDAPLRAALARVHPAHVGDYLRERLAAGLLGTAELPLALEPVAPVTAPAPATKAAPPAKDSTSKQAPPMRTPRDEREGIPAAVMAAGGEDEEGGPPPISALKALFSGMQ